MRAADEERELDGLADEQLLELAAGDTRRWAEAGRRHAGLGIVVGLDHGEFGAILNALTQELSARPEQADWADLTLFIARAT